MVGCVCVRARESEGGRETDRQTDRERLSEREQLCVCVCERERERERDRERHTERLSVCPSCSVAIFLFSVFPLIFSQAKALKCGCCREC